MSAAVAGLAGLTSPEGRPVEPAELSVRASRLDAGQLSRVRAAAHRVGRVLERDGLSVLGLGTAAYLELPAGLAAPGAARRAGDLLAAIFDRLEGEPVLAPIALGALPFDRLAPARLVVPELTVVAGGPCADGAPALAVLVTPPGRHEATLEGALDAGDGPGPDGDAAGEGTAGGGEAPDRFQLTSVHPHRAFRQLVEEALRAIGRGELDKVVLAREVEVVANRPLRQDDLLGRLRALHPSCASFALDGFVGASPELLCRRRGARVVSVPLAGTVARSGDPDEDARLASGLMASRKERAEHRLVVEAILAALGGVGAHVVASPEPSVLELRNVAHLATTIEGELGVETGRGRPASALELAAALHPTPAVGGWPTDAALRFLERHEPLERDRYAGPVGFVDGTGEGEWWLGIRSALVSGRRARLLAGVGIVAGSDPASELAETQLKLQALLAVAVRP